MAYTTHPNELDTKGLVRAGLIGFIGLAVVGVAGLGWSVFDHDSPATPAVVEFPTVDEMRAENMIIRMQPLPAPAVPANDDLAAESRERRRAAAGANQGSR